MYVSCCFEELVAEVRDSLGNLEKGNIRRGEQLPSNG
jgi:hypothetical protein